MTPALPQPRHRGDGQVAWGECALDTEISDPAGQVIEIDQAGFRPAVVTVSVGAVVEWTNVDGVDHSASSSDWDSGLIGDGQSFKRRFDQPGLYTYTDATNPANSATIIVGSGGSAGQSSIYLPIVRK